MPTGQAARAAWAATVGAAGPRLPAAMYAAPTPEWVRQLPAVETLRHGWVQQYYLRQEKRH